VNLIYHLQPSLTDLEGWTNVSNGSMARTLTLRTVCVSHVNIVYYLEDFTGRFFGTIRWCCQNYREIKGSSRVL
jgi:hypothetical protein